MSIFTAEQELKLEILAGGIKVDPVAEEAWRDEFDGPISLNEYASTSGICMSIEDGADGVWLNAPYTQEFTLGATARLTHTAAGFAVQRGDEEFSVSVVPVPAYHGKKY